ncbi:molecular chaperone DnaJ [Phycisphaera mikurensis]|uniref:Chaperone protein DnaJ n=1 Tax=Phycisphaera mikurensis (strain NBRC 102666 / KCTC 22515 / FYK2301M01) TaxID=1142394 RepID=I0IFV6_PHYMF|nr:molecular chaperone DnaJ [Phycisphaera mikurensis]MBB6440467.1 molecular chaperone DnaJ [Phycisphaera mikurensis]BAM04144.1 chaperone protein DnaJ [Phycisphaera mikurensis NBRC 102666]
MATQRDYYEVLSVERTADGDTIKRQYRKMAMKYHPDRNPGDAAAEASFKECAEAYEVLSDAEKRQRYDRHGHAGLRGGPAGHDFSGMNAHDISDLFADIFGGGGGRRGGGGRAGGVQRGYDLETQTSITLAEVLEGVEQEIEFTRQDVCETCKGSGGKPGTQPLDCTMCGGAGKVRRGGGFFQMITPCPNCNGTGKAYPSPCTACSGEGRVPLKRQLSVKIPPGIQDTQVIRVSGEGEPGVAPGGAVGPRGDLHVVVRVEEHELFERHDDHLLLKMPVGFTQAALGATVAVPTLTGDASVDIGAGSQDGDLVRLRGEGLPNLRTNRRGDLVVELHLEVPKKLTPRQRELLELYAQTEETDGRPADSTPRQQGFWDKIKTYLQ